MPLPAEQAGDPDLYSQYLQEKAGGAGTATPPSDGDLYSQYVKEKATSPSTYGLEPATATVPPPRKPKPGVYKSPIPAPIVAQPDVTETRKTTGGLASHLLTENPDPVTAVATAVGGMVEHPLELAENIAMTAPRAGAAWSDVLKGTGTVKEAGIQTLQAIALGAAGPAEKAVAARLLSTLGEKLGGAVASTVVGAGAGATFTPEKPWLGALLGGAGGATRIPGAVRDIGDVSGGAVEAGTQALKPPPPPPENIPVDQPQPLSRPQEVLRARLASEGVVPAGPITRRPAPVAPPAVEPAPEAQTYSTKGAVRRPAPGTTPVEAPARADLPPSTPLQAEYEAEQATAPPNLERRAEPERQAWTPEQRAQYITESQKKYAANLNKPWSQWSPEEKQAYFADQAKVRDTAPWKVEIETARQLVGDQEFQRRAIEAASQVPIGDKLEAVKKTAHEIVTGPPEEAAAPPAEPAPATWPPLPAEGDIRPVASANGEFDARPGIMRDVNRGEQPTDLPSPMRLPEPTPADRAVVQPKGYKEISPEEVAARKAAERPEPVATGTPADTSPAAAEVDDEGLFFEHRTPGGALRDVRRVSTDGLIKAHREMQDQIVRDQQSSIYRNVEADVSGSQYGVNINVGDRTERGTTYQSEAAQRLRNYQKVMDRINGELERRGLSGADVHDRIQEQEQLEAAIEQEAMQHNNAEEDAGDAFGDFDNVDERQQPRDVGERQQKAPAEKPASDVLNVAKLNLGSRTAEQRMAAKLEDFRTQRENNRQTFSEADVNRDQILNELRAGDPLALPTDKAKKLSGEELLARRDLVRENDRTITELSRQMESGTLPADAYAQASQLVERAVQHNDALLSDLVTGSSQKGRDLNLLRRLANDSTDPAVWRVQAKRMLGDRPLTAEIDAAIRKLASAAEDACR